MIPEKTRMFNSDTLHLAHIIAGEAGGCGFIAMLAVANVWTRNKRFYGNAPITGKSLMAAVAYSSVEDVTHGARYLFSRDDMRQRRVQELVARDGRASPQTFCNNQLFAW